MFCCLLKKLGEMGYNFSTIIIKRNGSNKDDFKLIKEYLEEKFEIYQTNASHEDYRTIRWNKRKDGWVAIYINQEVILIEDESFVIREQIIQKWSKKLCTEIIRGSDNSTACVSDLMIYQNGELIRHDSSEAGMTYEMSDGETIHIPKAFGEPTKYETSGDTMQILVNFIGYELDILDLQNMTIYKEK